MFAIKIFWLIKNIKIFPYYIHILCMYHRTYLKNNFKKTFFLILFIYL
jgi:hypothetical protein